MNFDQGQWAEAPPTSELIEATATVVSVEGDVATLETRRTNACNGCKASGACGTSALGEVLGRKRNLLRIDNTFDAAPGEQVIIGLRESDLLLASLAAYMLPLLLMIGAALAALALGLGEGASAIGALLGFAAGMWGAHHLSRRAGARFTPRFLRRLPFGVKPGLCGK